MVKTIDGRRQLLAAGLNPGLLRISIGLEPVEEMIKIFEEI
jgi:cystathionine beta-lyase/cystathionine gamma-synthase